MLVRDNARLLSYQERPCPDLVVVLGKRGSSGVLEGDSQPQCDRWSTLEQHPEQERAGALLPLEIRVPKIGNNCLER